MIVNNRLIKLAQNLIRIRSDNPTGNEAAVARFIASQLRVIKLKVKICEFKKKRLNVLAYMKGELNKSILISPHLDTVPAGSGWRHDPFAAQIKNNRIYGRGASDCKCNIAIAIEALRSLREDNIKPKCNVIFAATADEEAGSKYGLIPLLEKKILTPDCAVILDSGEFNIITSQKGLMHFKIKIAGKSAHGAYPERGINAIELASRIICDLKTYRFRYKKNPLFKGPTVNIGVIKGGQKVNIVADFCEFAVDLRYLPGMNKNRIIDIVKKITGRHAKSFKLEFSDLQKPYSIHRQHSLVRELAAAARKIKVNAKIKGSEGATVITFFQDRNIPAVSFGCGSSGCAHSSDEYVKVDNLYKGARILEIFLKNYF